MTDTARIGRQEPTQAVILPFSSTRGPEAVESYEQSGRRADDWQKLLISDILAVDAGGLWIHPVFGYEVPRQNGKGEVLILKELHSLENSRRVIHTAHRTSTSHAAYVKLKYVLDKAGYRELGKKKASDVPEPKTYKATKQYGLETITVTGGGEIFFRTRSEVGGLGETFDDLIIDEAQEYTVGQQGALQYTISAAPSGNPQTILCGTPPTMASKGTVFPKLRRETLAGKRELTGWAEWSVYAKPENLEDRDLWYETNPSLGMRLTERTVYMEDRADSLDFLIQRLGYWHEYALKSEITEADWQSLKLADPHKLKPKGKLYAAAKFGADGVNAALAIAVKTEDGPIFVEAIDCQSRAKGTAWIMRFLKSADLAGLVIDGKSGQALLAQQIEDEKGLRRLKVIQPTAGQAVEAYAAFRQAVDDGTLSHAGQPSLVQAVANCEKRLIGTNGAFGFRSMNEQIDVALVESVAFAFWLCQTAKERRKQRIRY